MFRACAIKPSIVAANTLCCCCCCCLALLFGKRLDTNLIRLRIRKYPDSPVHTLSVLFFPLWRADLKMSGFVVEFAGCVWTEAVSGKKKLRIQKYPDMCGRGLRFKKSNMSSNVTFYFSTNLHRPPRLDMCMRDFEGYTTCYFCTHLLT